MRLELLPYPRSVRRVSGFFRLPARAALHLDSALGSKGLLLPIAARLQTAVREAGAELELVTGPPAHPRLAIRAVPDPNIRGNPGGYRLEITSHLVTLYYLDEQALQAGVATLRQLLRQFGRRLPKLAIEDYPDFPRRGVMLDISRGRVPSLGTLLELVSHLADFKLNEFQLYTEHTFAYRDSEAVWGPWGALTGQEIRLLDARCRELGIDLVPNQNSFGHLRYWLEHPPLRRLAEVDGPYEGADGSFLRYPTTLAPTHPGTVPFLRRLYDELLPHFSSPRFNVGCDETWDLGRGQSRKRCETRGKGRVYLEFLKKIHREVSARGRQMMFWGDIVLHHPELIKELPEEVIALNWGYEANHPFQREAGLFAKSGVPFYVCPGTSTWMTLIGRHDNALTNLRLAAQAGLRHGAVGYLNTDWGDGGHPQPLAVSYLPYLVGAALSWCGRSFDEKLLVPVLSREVFHDPSQRLAKAALALGLAHRRFKYFAPNVTPFGAVVAAPLPKTREIPCRDGLKYYARIQARDIHAALAEVEEERTRANRSQPATTAGKLLLTELDLAARMAEQSCRIMLWQQMLASGRVAPAGRLASRGARELRELDEQFRAYWPRRNKGTPAKCIPFIEWRIKDYRQGVLHFALETARVAKPNPSPVE